MAEDGIKWAVGLVILGLAFVFFILPSFSSSPAAKGFAYVPAPVREAAGAVENKFNAFVGATPLPGEAKDSKGPSGPAGTGPKPGQTPGPSPTPTLTPAAATPVVTPLPPPKDQNEALRRYSDRIIQARDAETSGDYVKARDLYGAAKLDLDTARSLGLDDAGYNKENVAIRDKIEALGELQKKQPAEAKANGSKPEEEKGGMGWGSIGAIVAVIVLLPLLALLAKRKGWLSGLKRAKPGAPAATPLAPAVGGPFAIAFYRGNAPLDPAVPIALKPSSGPKAPDHAAVAASIVKGAAPIVPGVKNNIRFTVVSNNADAFISGEHTSWLGDKPKKAAKAGQSVNVWLDASGRASVDIVAGTKPGILVIKASWLALRESRKALSHKSTAEKELTVHIGNPADAQAAPAPQAKPSGIVLHLKADPSSFVLGDMNDRMSAITAWLRKERRDYCPTLGGTIVFKVESAPDGCTGHVDSGKSVPLRPGVSFSDTFSHNSASPMLFVRLDDVIEAGTIRISASWSSFLKPVLGSKAGVTYAVSYVDITVNEPPKRQKPSYELSLSADPAGLDALNPDAPSKEVSTITATLSLKDSGPSKPVHNHKLVFFIGSFKDKAGCEIEPNLCDFSIKSIDGKEELSVIGENKGYIRVLTDRAGKASVLFCPGIQCGTAVICVSHYVSILGSPASSCDAKSVPVGVGLKPIAQYDIDFRISPGNKDPASGDYLSLVPTGAFLALSARVCANGKAVGNAAIGFRVLDDGGTGAQLVTFENRAWVPKDGIWARMDGTGYAFVSLALGRKPGRIALEAFCVKQPKVSRKLFVQLKIDDKPDFGLSLTADAQTEKLAGENGLFLACVIRSELANHGVPVEKTTPIVFVLDDSSFSAGVRLGSGGNKANKHVDASSPQLCLIFVPEAIKQGTITVKAYCEKNTGISCEIKVYVGTNKDPAAPGPAAS